MEEPAQDAVWLLGMERLLSVGLAIFAVLGIGFLVAAWLTRLQSRLRDRRGRVEEIVAWLPLAQIAVWVLAWVIAVALLLRAPDAVVLAVLIPALLALALASRDLVRNAIAGVVLAFERSILAGDLIDISTPTGEVRGQVVAIGVRRTLLRRTDGSDVLIPNETLSNSTVRTNRAHEQDSAVEIELDVAEPFTTAEFPRVRKLAREAAAISRYASPHRRPEVHLEPTQTGRYRVTVQAYAFSPVYVRHLRTDVVSLFNESFARGEGSKEAKGKP